MTTINDQLLKGASAGDLAGVSQALEQGANVNAKDEYNNTSLNSAALWGHAEVVKRLLEAGADIENRGSGGGLTPLANAASRGHSDVAQILLDHGARVTDDLLSIVETKVNILEENREAGMVTEEGVTHWKGVLDFFITQRIKQDLPDVVPHLSSTDPAERREAATRVAEAAQRGIDVTAAASPLPALLSDADPDTRGQAGRALTYHLARVGDWPQVREILASTDVRLRLAASEARLLFARVTGPSLPGRARRQRGGAAVCGPGGRGGRGRAVTIGATSPSPGMELARHARSMLESCYGKPAGQERSRRGPPAAARLCRAA